MPVNQTNLAYLQTIETGLLAQLADMSTNFKPNYTVDGVTVSWNDLRKDLMSELATIRNAIHRENSAAVPALVKRYEARWKRWMDRSPIVGPLDRGDRG